MDSPDGPRAAAELLKSWALAAGFDRAGVAGLEPSGHGEFYLRWLARGDHAGMDYLKRRIEARLAPAAVAGGARSALCVALQYHPLAGEDEPEGDLWPRVARYARGRDYHELMGERLRRLAARIVAAFPGAVARPYVDTGPVLERELASRAGLGAVGKHTNLLHRQAGSWFLLAELFLSLDLAPDQPVADLCGRCTRCLEACPTGALPEAYHLDSRRCISYWTIEHRGALPAAAREMIGDWVFGCDLCQEACPYNSPPRGSGSSGLSSAVPLAGRSVRSARRDPPADHPDLRLPAERAGLDLVALLGMSRQDYVARFRGSPMKRAKLEGLQRNAAVAMGNRGAPGDPRYVPALVRALAGPDAAPDPVVRSHAAWSLGRLGGDTAREALERSLAAEADPAARAEIVAALSALDVAGSPGGRSSSGRSG